MFTPRVCQEKSEGWRKVEKDEKKKCDQPIFECETREKTSAARVFTPCLRSSRSRSHFLSSLSNRGRSRRPRGDGINLNVHVSLDEIMTAEFRPSGIQDVSSNVVM